MGGVYIINCQHLVVFSGHDVITFSSWHPDSILPNFDIYNNLGVRSAWVTNGKLLGPQAMKYSIKKTDEQWTCMERDGNRILCLLVKKKEVKTKKYAMLLEVSLDLRLPDGNYFRCNAQESNLKMMEGMKGSTFLNGETVLSVN